MMKPPGCKRFQFSYAAAQLETLETFERGVNYCSIMLNQHCQIFLPLKVIVAPQSFHALADSSSSEAEAGKGKV